MSETLLIVEDEGPIRHILADAFRREDYQVYEGEDGEQALSLALEKKPDLMLLDVMIPKMDGIAVLKKLREDPWGKTARVILLTNLSPDETMTLETAKLDAASYMVKSNWRIEDIVRKVKETLAMGHSA